MEEREMKNEKRKAHTSTVIMLLFKVRKGKQEWGEMLGRTGRRKDEKADWWIRER